MGEYIKNLFGKTNKGKDGNAKTPFSDIKNVISLAKRSCERHPDKSKCALRGWEREGSFGHE